MMKKKILCILLSAAMVLTAMDFPALASKAQTTVTEDGNFKEDTTPTQTEDTAEGCPEQETTETTETAGTASTENQTENQETEATAGGTAAESTQPESETASPEETETAATEPAATETEESTGTETEESTEPETETETETEETTAPESEETDTALWAAYRTADEIREFLEQEKSDKTDSVTYDMTPVTEAPYSAGALSDATLGSATALLRQIRFIAGLPCDVAVNDDYSHLSQSAALLNYLSNAVSSDPSQPSGMSDELFQQGCEGIASSCTAYTDDPTQTLNAALLDTWMAANDSRKRILNPSLEQVGFGAVKGENGLYSAMYTADTDKASGEHNRIAWPAQNMPVEYFDSRSPWSVTTGELLDASEITVTLTRKADNKTWIFSADASDGVFQVESDRSAQESTILFCPEDEAAAGYTDGDSFQVEISKNKKPYIKYSVAFFSVTEEEEILTAPEASIATGENVAKESRLILTSAEDAAIYYTLDGTTPSTDSALYAEPISITEDITVKAIAVKEGYTDSDIAEFVYTVMEDAPLWYNITFESNGGTMVPAQSILENEKIELPIAPDKEGYLLEGWFKEAECETIWDFEKDTVTADITLYAKWAEDPSAAEYTVSGETETNTYVITFDLQGIGTQIEPITINNGETFAAPETPVAEGYTFAEWYQEAECINAWDFEADIVTEDIVLYAKWISDNAEISMSASKETKEEDTRIDIGVPSSELQTNDIKPRRYNGKPYEPRITVSILNGNKRVTLKKDRDYELTYKNNINAGNRAAAVLKGIGKYKGQKTIYFTITPPINLSLQETQTIVSDIKEKRYNSNKPYEPSVTVSALDGNKRVTLKKDRDYTLTYEGNSNTGTEAKQAFAVITGKGEYTGTVKKEFTLLPQIDLSLIETNTTVKDIKPRVYNGKAYEPNVSVSAHNGTKQVPLKKGRDYTLKYDKNINAGENTASVTITGTGEYKGSVTKNFTITPKSIKKLKIVTDSMRINSTAADIYVFDGTTYVSWRNYTVKYNVNPDKPKQVTADITANDGTNYTGTVRVKFTVYDVPDEKLIDGNSVPGNYGSAVYTGKPITRDIKDVKAKDGSVLRPNKDYSVKYQNNINIGKATVTITGKGKYKGKVVRTFDITRAGISNGEHITITSNIPSITYNGKTHTPTAVTVMTSDNKKLALNKDYTLAYSNNLHAGTATITVTGINNCNGTAKTTFEIAPQKIEKASVSVTKKTKENPVSKVVLKYNQKELTQYTDYMITDYEENGSKIKVEITGIGDFTGKVTKNLSSEIEIPKEEPKDAPLNSSNINRTNYLNFWDYGIVIRSNLFQNDDGTLTRVEFISGKGVVVEEYTAGYEFIRQKKLINPELPIFGGFYASKDNYFLAFGQKNMGHSNDVEVIRFVKYDKDWNRIGDARIFGFDTQEPFIFSCVRMIEHEGILYVYSGKNMYNGHQRNMAFTIRIEDMKFISTSSPVYSSHSLNQLMVLDDPYMVLVDHGDAYPRGIILSRNKKADNGVYLQSRAESITALQIGGEVAQIVTGASVSGLEASDTSYLVVGRSGSQPPNDYKPNGVLNIYVSSTPKDNFKNEAVKVNWITNYDKILEYTDAKGNKQTVWEKEVYNPQLIKLSGKEMILMWTEITAAVEDNKVTKDTKIKSVLLNESGDPISGMYSFDGALSDCAPILINGNLVWYYTNGKAPIFCTLNPEDVRKVPR